ncbi:hypothetical protein D3C72_1731820 [compost metagenome]
MLLITAVMSAIFFELVLISLMVLTTSRITRPPWVAVCDASAASLLAWRALSALFFTVAVNSSILAAVSTTAAACCSVRDERSVFPSAISLAASDTCATLVRTSPIIARSVSFMRPIAPVNLPSSSSP